MTRKVIKTLGFLGTGVMGTPMVRRLLAAGFAVRVWNRTSAKTDSLQTLGAVNSKSPAEAADGVDALLLCLSDAAAMEATLFGSLGVVQTAVVPPLVIDFSTIGPVATLSLAQRLHTARQIAWVDAPVSGGVTGAEQGKLAIFCGGSEADVARAAAIFSVLSQRFTRVGCLGSGQTLKLCNQLIVSATVAAIAESLALARASGLKIETLPEALAGGFADSLPLQVFGRRMAMNVSEPVLGELGLMLKDVRAVHALAEATQIRLPMLAATLEVYLHSEQCGLLCKDLSALFSLYDRPNSAR